MRARIMALLVAFACLTARATPSANPLARSMTSIEKRLGEIDGLSHHHATGIVQDKDGVIWVGTWNGLSRFDGYGFTTFKPQPGDGSPMGVNRIKDLRIRGYEIYCNVEYHCFIFDIRDGKFRDSHLSWQQVMRQKSFSPDGPKRLRGKDGISWVVDSMGVLMTYQRPYYVERLLSQPGCQVRTLFRDRQGRIWVCSRDDRTIRLYDSSMHLLGFLQSDGKLSPRKAGFLSSVYALFQDHSGIIWMGCKPGGLYRLTPSVSGGFHVEAVHHDASGQRMGNEVYGICQDSWGRMWIATMDEGLFCIPNTQGSSHFVRAQLGKEARPDKYRSVRTLFITHNNQLMVGTTQGLFVTQLTKANPSIFHFLLHEREGNRYGSLSNSAIMSIMEDGQHRLYVCTEGGGVNQVANVGKLLSPNLEFLHFDKREMPDDFIASAFEYRRFSWFVGTTDLTGLDAQRNEFLYFDHDTWQSDLLFSDAHPLSLGHGKWLLGLMDGLAVIDMDALLTCGKVPHIVLTSVLIEDSELREAVTASDTIRMGETQRNVRITFAALDYRNSKSINYRFQLDGGGWNNLENTNSVTLLNLSPGEHHLLLESKMSTGNWAGNVREITICVKPTIWQTTMAKVMYAVFVFLLLLVVYWVVSSMRRSKREQKKLLDSYLNLLEKYDSAKHVAKTESAPKDKSAELSQEDQMFMHCIIEFVEQHIDDSDLSVNELASMLGISKSGLNRKLKNLVGVTPKEFVTKARMNRAVILLETTQLPVKEIAYGCGFSDQNYFGKCFRSSFGVSPSEYRQNHGV